MTKAELPKRFYRLLYFSPRPEDEERVCVGIVFQDDRKTFLDFDDKLEKAHCFAPDFAKESLAFILQTIQGDAERIAREGKLVEFSPQFLASAPRALLHPVDEKVRSLLRQKYLLKPKSFEHKRKEKGVERRLDNFLIEKFQVPYGVIHRKTTIDDLLGFEASRELPKDLVPKPVSRALISDSDICLLDGVDLHLNSTDLLVNRINRVAHTFWQYSKVKEVFPELKRRHILTAAIVFDGSEGQVEPSLKWRADYAFHQFEKDANITVKAGSAQQELAMRDKLKNLLPQT